MPPRTREKGGGIPLRPSSYRANPQDVRRGVLGTTLSCPLSDISASAPSRAPMSPASSASTGGAHRCHDILRNMFHCAIAWGNRPEAGENPCSGIARYRRPRRGRLLGADDPAKLGAVLRHVETDSSFQVAAVWFPLPTGCRPGEIRRLRRREVKSDRLALIDAKTGPRHVLLDEAAERVAVAIHGKPCGSVEPGSSHVG